MLLILNMYSGTTCESDVMVKLSPPNSQFWNLLCYVRCYSICWLFFWLWRCENTKCFAPNVILINTITDTGSAKVWLMQYTASEYWKLKREFNYSSRHLQLVRTAWRTRACPSISIIIFCTEYAQNWIITKYFKKQDTISSSNKYQNKIYGHSIKFFTFYRDMYGEFGCTKIYYNESPETKRR